MRRSQWLAGPFALASNALFPVATVLGERLLYLPSEFSKTSWQDQVGGALAGASGRVKWEAGRGKAPR
jgi:hypothetical protein